MNKYRKTKYVRMGGKLFTPEEVALADLAMSGIGNAEIAEKLHLSISFVQKRFNHSESVCFYHRTGEPNRTAFASWWKEAKMMQNDRDLTYFHALSQVGSKLLDQAYYQPALDQFDTILEGIERIHATTSSEIKKEELLRLEADVLLEKIRIKEDIHEPKETLREVKKDWIRIHDIGNTIDDEAVLGPSYVRLGEGYYVTQDYENALHQLQIASDYHMPSGYQLLYYRHRLLSTAYLEGRKAKSLCSETWKKAQPYLLDAIKQGDHLALSFLEGYGRALCICKDSQGMYLLRVIWPEAGAQIGIQPNDNLRYLQRYRSIGEGARFLQHTNDPFVREAISKGNDLLQTINSYRYRKIYKYLRKIAESASSFEISQSF